MFRGSSKYFAMVCVLTAVSACEKNAGVPANGAISLSVKSAQPVDKVIIKVYDVNGNTTSVEYDTKGKDLTKEQATGEILPSTAMARGPLLFVGFGYTTSGTKVVTEGRTLAEFAAGKRTNALLSLLADVVDVDGDGFLKAEDCDDRDAGQNPFFAEKCGNGLDDNCNGSYDEGCACKEGEQHDCYNGPPGTRGVGECRDGLQKCTGAKWGDCTGWVGPQKQVCETNKDGNCDGSIDEGCPCASGTVRPCWGRSIGAVGALASTIKVSGMCKAGVQSCVGSAWGACAGAVYEEPEVCNGLDDDCDGERDDGFDRDKDGYTTCGTFTSVVEGACQGKVQSGRTDPSVADCDDGNAERHPCQPDKCGDGNEDDNCDSEHNECQGAGSSCGAEGYYGGWVPAVNSADKTTRFETTCTWSGASFGTTCLTATQQCSTASSCEGQLGSGKATDHTKRTVCHEPVGCKAGTKEGPKDGAKIASGDPYNDCGGVDCDKEGERVFAGRTSDTGTGWRVVDHDGVKRYECHVWQPIDASAHDCDSGICETPRDACFSHGSVAATMLSAVAGATITAPCQQPEGATGSHLLGVNPYLGHTCYSNSAKSFPPKAEAVNNAPDPLQRCPPVNGAACAQIVKTKSSATSDCTFVSSTIGNISFCGDNSSCLKAEPTEAQCKKLESPVTTITCPAACRNTSACSEKVNTSKLEVCFNANGGPKGGSCGQGKACFDPASTGGGQTATACNECTKDYACGSTCAVCGTEQDCKAGVDTSKPALTFKTSPAGSENGCLCTTPIAGVTIPTSCGDKCCRAGEYCGAKGCITNNDVLAIPCGTGRCARGTEYCNVTGPAMKCESLPTLTVSCNQRYCPYGSGCKDFAGSICGP